MPFFYYQNWQEVARIPQSGPATAILRHHLLSSSSSSSSSQDKDEDEEEDEDKKRNGRGPALRDPRY